MARKTLQRSLNKPKTPTRNRRKDLAAPFLMHTHAAVKTVMAATETLPDFRKTPSELATDEKIQLVRQGMVLVRDNYVHLPLKENMHAVRPVQALSLLLQKLESSEDEMSDLEFHAEMLRIFTSVRDLHTNYFLPAPYNAKTAYVPFLLESYFEGDERRYLVSHLVAGLDQPPFGPGVEVTSWNGAPIDLAVATNATRFAGSNMEARRARGLERMTIRPLIQSLPPDEDFVLVGYRTADGAEHEIRLNWLVFTPDASGAVVAQIEDVSGNAFAMGVDIDGELAGIAKKLLFAPSVVAAEAAVRAKKPSRRRKKFDVGEAVPSSMPSVLHAKTVDTAAGQVGHIRIHTFSVDDADAFVAEFVRLAELLPQNGLIIDVRGNGGGLIYAGERLLQVLTPQPIETERTQFINTALNLDIVRKNAPSSSVIGLDLAPWRDSMEESISTGAVYSRSYPITEVETANGIGQRYQGPVVLITDAKCYSTTDIFAAGFQDHDIGPIIGVDGNTGAGGANVWTHSLLRRLAGRGGPYARLPGGANMRVAIRRTLRVKDRSGTPVEDLGVQPDFLHNPTRADLLDGNVDLIEFAASKLAELPTRVLRGEIVSQQAGDLTISIETENLARVDVYLDNRPIGALDVEDGDTELTIEDVGAFDTLYLQGFDGDELAAAWRINN
ncbi:S41 family peptidase [uncultured Roseobacter sp.]|uniref:S41 family peptidase n=1 Tax=uncultured Roseobacter sp. TaxID=114847 RepID=UPI0026239FCF|nr:S41 family peptidase [uncultured Roseobacter sp.]